MAKPTKGEPMETRKKQLINLPEDQKAWIMRVVELADDSNQTEVIRVLIAQAMVEDPESFVGKLGKLKLKARLADIERRAQALDSERSQLLEELQVKRGDKGAHSDRQAAETH